MRQNDLKQEDDASIRTALIWLSGSAIENADPDTDPGARKLTKIKKLTWFPAFQMAFVSTHR
jgi:hypothetical protein